MDGELSEVERLIALHFYNLQEREWLFVKELIKKGILKKLNAKDSEKYGPFRE